MSLNGGDVALYLEHAYLGVQLPAADFNTWRCHVMRIRDTCGNEIPWHCASSGRQRPGATSSIKDHVNTSILDSGSKGPRQGGCRVLRILVCMWSSKATDRSHP